MDTQIIFNTIVILIVLAIFYVLLRRSRKTNPDEEMTVFEYSHLILQAEQTARIIVRGVQEAWRTGDLEDDEREDDAIDQLAEMYPELDEEVLRRIVKSAVYLLRLGAGKQVDRVMEQTPGYNDALTMPNLSGGDGTRRFIPDYPPAATHGITPDHLRDTGTLSKNTE